MRIKNVNPKGWYDIPGYDGIYQINYWADIRKKLGNGKYKYLKPYVKKNNQGKRLIKLKRKEVVVMSLMRITFIGDLPKGYVTYHKNGIKTDDILGNIGVITKKELSKKTGQGIIEVRKRREMTRKDILKKHGFSWTSNVNLKEELSEQAVPEFLTKRMNLPVRREEETGWKKQMYNKFMKGAGR